jgi:carbon monoxide dehydrogenase subunit G
LKFEDSFQVPVSLPETWDALTDIERVYPCLPGAQLIEVADNEFRGLVTLKLGPISASYKGVARFDSLDRENAKLVIHAEGRDKHGQGTAKARISAQLVPAGDGETCVKMVNEIDITGKAAQFGRGVLTDVSKEMMGQFAANLRDVVSAPPAVNGHAEQGPAESRPDTATAPIDTVSLARQVLARKAQESPLGTVLAVVFALYLLRRMMGVR